MRHALRGDRQDGERLLAETRPAISNLQSNQLEAAQGLLDGWMAVLSCDWESVATHAAAPSVNSNFASEAGWVMAVAAAAGNLGEDLDAAIRALEESTLAGAVTDRVHSAAVAARSARQGRWDEAHAGFELSRDWLLEHGDLTYGHLAGLLWSLLTADRRPEAAAASAAADAFFAERGAMPFVAAFRAAFVPGEALGSRAESTRDAPAAAEIRPR
jgi:hypothetical protein